MQVRMQGFLKYTRFEEALGLVLKNIKKLPLESISFDRALGRVIAEDVVAKVDVPPFSRAHVDGYAVRASDTFGASEFSPVTLRVIGSIDIGMKTKLHLKKRQAAKIMTGAQMPMGADAVVMVEHAKEENSRVAVFVALPPGKNVSRRGEDIRAGEVVVKKGKLLRPQEIGILAATGNTRIIVARRPRVAILATGDELCQPKKRLKPALVYDSNSYSLAASVVSCGGVVKQFGIVRDEPKILSSAISRALREDVVLISGGSSVGERDIVPSVISKFGKLLFHGVAIRPGSPTAFGVINRKPVFALAGSPVASLVVFDFLVRPALRYMQGLPADRGFYKVQAKLARKISSTLGRVDVVRVKLHRKNGKFVVEPIRVTGSGILSSMTDADGFVVVPEDVEVLEKGVLLEVELYR